MLKVGFRLPEPWNHTPQDIAVMSNVDQKLLLVLLPACKEESYEDDAKGDEGKGREGGLKPLFST